MITNQYKTITHETKCLITLPHSWSSQAVHLRTPLIR